VQGAVRFVTGLEGVTSTLVGTTRTAHLEEAVQALAAPVERQRARTVRTGI